VGDIRVRFLVGSLDFRYKLSFVAELQVRVRKFREGGRGVSTDTPTWIWNGGGGSVQVRARELEGGEKSVAGRRRSSIAKRYSCNHPQSSPGKGELGRVHGPHVRQ
jgi:hypothetical protein